jgi:hypothetical protein
MGRVEYDVPSVFPIHYPIAVSAPVEVAAHDEEIVVQHIAELF